VTMKQQLQALNTHFKHESTSTVMQNGMHRKLR